MKSGLYSLYDKKAEYHSKPVPMQNDDIAMRSIKNTMYDEQSKDTDFVKNPEDFTLVRVGFFDDGKGTLTEEYKPLVDLITLVKGEKDEK